MNGDIAKLKESYGRYIDHKAVRGADESRINSLQELAKGHQEHKDMTTRVVQRELVNQAQNLIAQGKHNEANKLIVDNNLMDARNLYEFSDKLKNSSADRALTSSNINLNKSKISRNAFELEQAKLKAAEEAEEKATQAKINQLKHSLINSEEGVKNPTVAFFNGLNKLVENGEISKEAAYKQMTSEGAFKSPALQGNNIQENREAEAKSWADAKFTDEYRKTVINEIDAVVNSMESVPEDEKVGIKKVMADFALNGVEIKDPRTGKTYREPINVEDLKSVLMGTHHRQASLGGLNPLQGLFLGRWFVSQDEELRKNIDEAIKNGKIIPGRVGDKQKAVHDLLIQQFKDKHYK